MPVYLLCEDDQTPGSGSGGSCLHLALVSCSGEGLSALVETCEPHRDHEDSRDTRLFSAIISAMAAKSGEIGAFLIYSS
jgi:hypothetical protein